MLDAYEALRPDGSGWRVGDRYSLLAAAKARGKTLDEYVAGGPTRWMHVQEEIAFDALQVMLTAVETAPKPDADDQPRRGRARR